MPEEAMPGGLDEWLAPGNALPKGKTGIARFSEAMRGKR
jgi:hypothetical protein